MKKKEPPKVLTNLEIADLYNKFDYTGRSLIAADFVQAMQKPNTLIFDLRDKDQYQTGHVKGAVHLGADVTIEKLKKLAPDTHTTILVYCQNSFEMSRMVSLTHMVAPQLYILGYKNVYYLEFDIKNIGARDDLIPWEGEK